MAGDLQNKFANIPGSAAEAAAGLKDKMGNFHPDTGKERSLLIVQIFIRKIR